MSWYKEYRSQWKEIIETVARELGRTELMVEKDTIQSMFLLKLSKSELPFVFKGGTSLSKAYNLIDRFSEDIDLSMNRKPTEGEPHLELWKKHQESRAERKASIWQSHICPGKRQVAFVRSNSLIRYPYWR